MVALAIQIMTVVMIDTEVTTELVMIEAVVKIEPLVMIKLVVMIEPAAHGPFDTLALIKAVIVITPGSIEQVDRSSGNDCGGPELVTRVMSNE